METSLTDTSISPRVCVWHWCILSGYIYTSILTPTSIHDAHLQTHSHLSHDGPCTTQLLFTSTYTGVQLHCYVHTYRHIFTRVLTDFPPSLLFFFPPLSLSPPLHCAHLQQAYSGFKSILTIFLWSIKESIGLIANLCHKAVAIHLAERVLKWSDLSFKWIFIFH